MSGWLSFVLFQLVWCAAVLGAARDEAFWGPLAALVLLAYSVRRTRSLRADLYCVAAAIGVALCLDGALGWSGSVRYAAHVGPTWLAPAWIVALWVGFATTLTPALGWLKTRLVLAAVLGAVFGPLAYYSGQGLGALSIVRPRAVVILGVGWAIAMPLLLLLSRRLGAPASSAARGAAHEVKA